jgi:carboxypeptidase T
MKFLNSTRQILLKCGFLAVTLTPWIVADNSYGDTAAHIVEVLLPRDRQSAQQDLQKLSKFDIHGVNWKKSKVVLSVKGSELSSLLAMGFTPNFATAADIDSAQTLADISSYMTPDEVVQKLQDLEKQYSHLAKVFEVGRTTKGRPLLGIEITSDGDNDSKPVILFNAMHHARELMTTEIVMHMAKTLLEGFGNEADITRWLGKFRIVIVPQVNPDGNDLVHTGGRKMWRKNAFVQRNNIIGVDLNRNYPAFWNYCNGSSGSSGSDTYRGPTSGSEPETKGMMALVEKLKPVADISYHSYSELIIYPYGCRSVANPSAELFRSIGNEMRLHLEDDDGQKNTYQVGTAPGLLYEADGTDLDWQWQEHGVLAYTIEANSSGLGFQPNYDRWRDVTVKRQEGAWKALIARMEKSAVKARVRSSSPLTYTVHAVGSSGIRVWGADRKDPSFTLRNENGLLFQVLQKGNYEIRFARAGSVVKTIPVTITDGVTELGEINID